MIIVDRELVARQEAGNPIRVGLIGAGYMGKGIARQIIEFMPGMDVVGIANRTLGTAAEVFEACGVSDGVTAASTGELDDLLEAGNRVITSEADELAASRNIDVIIEATGEVEHGARAAMAAIDSVNHVVLVNAELDATVGPILKTKADEAGIVFTNADGDEPGVAMNLVRFVRTIGFEPVMAGNVKGFYDRHRNPDTQLGFAAEHGQRPKMVTSFADGTKMSMEASVLTNATGFSVAQRGMTGHRCNHVRDVLDLYDLEALVERPLVDYVLGAEPGSGAFVVGYSEDADRQSYMKYFKMGDGPFHVFYRPFHLTHLEAPLSAARAVLFGDATIAPAGAPMTEVIAYAKRDLSPGDTLDGIGGFDCYGIIDNVADLDGEPILPMGLTDGCVVTSPVAADEPIPLASVRLPAGRLVDELRAEQDSLFARV